MERTSRRYHDVLLNPHFFHQHQFKPSDSSPMPELLYPRELRIGTGVGPVCCRVRCDGIAVQNHAYDEFSV